MTNDNLRANSPSFKGEPSGNPNIRYRHLLQISDADTISAKVAVLPGAIFAYHAPRYLDLGYSPIPRFESGSYPPAWSDYCVTAASPDQIERWGKAHNANIVLACGYAGLVAIDADTKQMPILDAIRRALPQCNVGRYGSKGFALLCRHLDPAVKSSRIYWADPDIREPMVEIKASGQNITVPPSVHRKTGQLYRWIDVESGVGIMDPVVPLIYPPPLAELPVIDDADIERLRAALAPWARPPRQPPPPRPGFDPNKIPKSRYEAWYRAGLTNASSELSGAREGRPTMLFKKVCGLGAGVHHGFIPKIEFESAFLGACDLNGLSAREGRHAILATIESGLRCAADDALPDLGEPQKPRKSRANGGASGATASNGEGERSSTPARPGNGSQAGKEAAAHTDHEPQAESGLTLDDFYAVLPTHQYLFIPTRVLWTSRLNFNSFMVGWWSDEPERATDGSWPSLVSYVLLNEVSS